MAATENAFIQSIKWLLKWLGIAFGSLVALVLVGIAIAFGWNWYSYDRHVAKIKIETSNDVGRDGLLNDLISNRKRCTKEFPIFIAILNDSSKTINSISLTTRAHLPGHSTNILGSYESIALDNVIEPNNGWSNCYRFKIGDSYKENPESPNAIYQAEIVSVVFK